MYPLLKQCTKQILAYLCSIILAGTLFFWAPFAVAGEKTLPFPIGETLHYKVRWEAISAGKATFSVLDFSQVDGKKALHFLLEIESNRYIDFLYKIRDRHEGFTDPLLNHSLSYKKVQNGRDKKNVVVEFDWDRNTATYSNFGGKRDPLTVPEQTLDPLSAFYKMRTLNLDVDNGLSFPVTDGKKQFVQKGEVIKKETLTLPSGTWETVLLIPQVNNFSGVFEKSENPTVKLWVTADEKRLPVRMKVKVFIGSVIFDLVLVQ